MYDNTKLTAANPYDPKYGPVTACHWWREPWFGYYINRDESVIRKHAQMLTDAGIDVMIFDNTNGPTYPDDYQAICRVFTEMRKAGMTTPQIAFITGHGAAEKLYRDFYSKHLYPELWFQWAGKPLMMVHEEVSDAVKSFFTVRESWAWSNRSGWFGDGHDRWCWLDHHPQAYGWHESASKPEQISVCAAEHPTTSIGRSFHRGSEPPSESAAPASGLYFAEQWERALQVAPPFVFVTGWNEWTAQRFLATGPAPLPGVR